MRMVWERGMLDGMVMWMRVMWAVDQIASELMGLVSVDGRCNN